MQHFVLVSLLLFFYRFALLFMVCASFGSPYHSSTYARWYSRKSTKCRMIIIHEQIANCNALGIYLIRWIGCWFFSSPFTIKLNCWAINFAWRFILWFESSDCRTNIRLSPNKINIIALHVPSSSTLPIAYLMSTLLLLLHFYHMHFNLHMYST